VLIFKFDILYKITTTDVQNMKNKSQFSPVRLPKYFIHTLWDIFSLPSSK